MNKFAVEAALGVLANNMRIYVEAQMRFRAIFKVDREEAVNNVDRAFEAKLEALHTLYDVTRSEISWFDFGDTAVLIGMRNAIHHRDHPLFRSLNSAVCLDGEYSNADGAALLLARHKMVGDPPIMMEHHFKLDDFRSRLDPDASSPHLLTFKHIVEARRRYKIIADGLAFEKVFEIGRENRFPAAQIYIEMLPVFISATSRVFKALLALGIEFQGFDAEVYKQAFTAELAVDLSAFTFRMLRLHGLHQT